MLISTYLLACVIVCVYFNQTSGPVLKFDPAARIKPHTILFVILSCWQFEFTVVKILHEVEKLNALLATYFGAD